MKKLIYISTLALVLTLNVARADDKKQTPDDVTPRVETTQIQSDNAGTERLMKIQEDEKTDASRKQTFIEELRKLYKANFL